MKKVIAFTEDQIAQIGALLNGITSMGVKSAKNIAVIAQILDGGAPGEIKEPEGKEKIKGFYSQDDWKDLSQKKDSEGDFTPRKWESGSAQTVPIHKEEKEGEG